MLEWAHNCGKKPPLSSVSSPHCRQWCSRLHALCSAPPPTLARRILSPWVQFMIQFRHWNTQIFLHTFLQSSKLEMKDSSSTAPAAPPIGGEKCWENNITHADKDKSGNEFFNVGPNYPSLTEAGNTRMQNPGRLTCAWMPHTWSSSHPTSPRSSLSYTQVSQQHILQGYLFTSVLDMYTFQTQRCGYSKAPEIHRKLHL